jgi:hypothetical protein
MLFSWFKRRPTPSLTLHSGQYQHYTGSFYRGNYVWSGAMNLCWAELCGSVMNGPLTLRTDDPAALRMVEAFNHPVCTTTDLDAPSYYVKAGFGPQTVAEVNRESRARFPEKSFPDLRISLGEHDILSYAYFYKKVAYVQPFSRCNMRFEGAEVAGFEAMKDQKKVVEVLWYEHDDRFIIRLKLKDPADELWLAKGFDMQHPEALLRQLTTLNDPDSSTLSDTDYFKMPLLSLQCKREYPELTGKPIGNEGFEQYLIGMMFENIAFELDEVGAKVESQAVISVERAAAGPSQKRRYFYLDKPFWVMMKRSDAARPFFLLGVNNTEIMQTISI